MQIFYKIGVLKNSDNSQESVCAGVSFNEVANLTSATLLKSQSSTGFLCEFCETFNNAFFTEHLRTPTFGILM